MGDIHESINIPSGSSLNITKGLILAIFSACFFGSAGVATKALSVAGFSSLEITQGRMSIAAVILLLFAVCLCADQLKIAFHEWPRLLIFGLMGFFVNQALYSVAVSRIPVGIALLLEYLAPAMIIFYLVYFKKEQIQTWIWLGIASIILGLSLVALPREGFHLDVLGVAAGIGTAMALAARFAIAEQGLVSRGPLALSTIGATIGCIAANLAALMTFPLSKLGDTVTAGLVRLDAWMFFLWLALVATVLAYLTGLAAQKHLSCEKSSQLATLEVIFAGGFATVLLGEALTAIQFLGGVVMIAGILLSQYMVARYKDQKADS